MLAAVSGSTTTLVLVLAVFLAASVEMVEALTIVVAVGHTRGWRSALEGTGVAVLASPRWWRSSVLALVRVPLDPLRLVVGSVLLIFRSAVVARKAILRSHGYIGMHDEDAIYEKTVASLRAEGKSVGRDRLAFVVAFKGVFLEGTEIVVAVLTLGTSAPTDLGLAITVAAIAVAARRHPSETVVARTAVQGSREPDREDVRGRQCWSASGTFWTGSRDSTFRWPAATPCSSSLVVLYAVVVTVAIRLVAQALPRPSRQARVKKAPPGSRRARRAVGKFWWDFLVGDTPEITVVVILILGVIALASEVAHLNVLA